MAFSRTVVIGCAGMGNRLGMGMTKALLEIDGKPLIIRQLEFLKDEEDVRVVVGYQAKKLMEVVRNYRNDVMFVFNHLYQTTSTGKSVSLASKYANDFVLNIDGDLIIHPEDMEKILSCHTEFVGGGIVETEDPWLVKTDTLNGETMAVSFSRMEGEYEWNGIAQVRRDKFTVENNGHVFRLLEPHLPMPFLFLRTREVDTVGDYEKAIEWVGNDFGGVSSQ